LRFSYLAAAFPASMLLTNIISFYNASTFEIINSTYDIENTAEVRAYRNGYQKEGPDRDAFIHGWCDGTDMLLHRQ